MELSDGEFENHVNQLLEWSETLDFDNYLQHWWQVATSAPSNQIGDVHYQNEEEEIVL